MPPSPCGWRKPVEMGVVKIHVIYLQNRQHRVDHGRGSAGIGVDNSAQRFGAQMALKDLVNETGFALPHVLGSGVRQRGNELEVGQFGRDRSEFVEHEQIRARSRTIKEANWSLLAAADMIGND